MKQWLAQSRSESGRITPALAGLGLLLICLLIYGVALDAPLIFDDRPNISGNPQLLIDGETFDEWRTASLSSESGVLRRPIAMFSFAVNGVAAGGWDPAELKGTNLVIHLVCGVLVYCLALALFRQLLGERSEKRLELAALLAAACWLLHPLHVSTVLYAVQRMAQLSALFMLLGLVVFCHYRRQWAENAPGVGGFLAALLWLLFIFFAGILSKENAVLLPWLILVLEVAVYRGRWAGGELAWLNRLAWVLLVLPVALVVAIYIVDKPFLAAGYGHRPFSLDERLVTQARLLWHYVGWILLPDIRQMGFQHDDIPVSRALLEPVTGALSIAAWLVVVAFALIWRRREPLLLLSVLFFLVGHALESSVLALEMVFEHRNYLPSVGLCLGLAGLLNRGWLPAQVRPRVIVLPVLIVLVGMLFARTQIWSDPQSFSRANVTNHPESVRAQFYYANYLYGATGGESGASIDDETHRAMIVASYEHFVKMQSESERGSTTALVMLYLMESYYFTHMPEREDRLEELRQVMAAGPLQASDFSALASLVDCALGNACTPDRARIISMIDELLQVYPGSRQFLHQKYRLLAIAGSQSDRREVLARLVAHAQHAPDIYNLQIQDYMHTGERGMAYQAMFEWMRADKRRLQLDLLKAHVEAGEM